MTDLPTTLLNTKLNDMTVGQAVKLNVIVLASMVGFVAVTSAYGATKDSYNHWKLNREGTQEENPELATE